MLKYILCSNIDKQQVCRKHYLVSDQIVIIINRLKAQNNKETSQSGQLLTVHAHGTIYGLQLTILSTWPAIAKKIKVTTLS